MMRTVTTIVNLQQTGPLESPFQVEIKAMDLVPFLLELLIAVGFVVGGEGVGVVEAGRDHLLTKGEVMKLNQQCKKPRIFMKT